MATFEARGVRVQSWAGALWIDHPQGSVLIDAPVGVHTAIAHHGGLSRLRSIVVTHDRMTAMGGLLGVLDAVTQAPRASPAVQLVHPTHTERAGLIAGAWSRGWPQGVRLDIDGAYPGHAIELKDGGSATFTDLALTERSRTEGQAPVPGGGVVIEVAGVRIAWAPFGQHSTSALRRMARGTHLLVVGTDRLSLADTRSLGAQQVWIMQADGTQQPDTRLTN